MPVPLPDLLLLFRLSDLHPQPLSPRLGVPLGLSFRLLPRRHAQGLSSLPPSLPDLRLQSPLPQLPLRLLPERYSDLRAQLRKRLVWQPDLATVLVLPESLLDLSALRRERVSQLSGRLGLSQLAVSGSVSRGVFDLKQRLCLRCLRLILPDLRCDLNQLHLLPSGIVPIG